MKDYNISTSSLPTPALVYLKECSPLLCADLEPGGGVPPEPRLQAAGEARPEQQLPGVAGGAGDQLGAQDRAQPPRPQEQRHQRGQLSATLSKYLEGKHRLLNSNYLERLDKCFQAK